MNHLVKASRSETTASSPAQEPVSHPFTIEEAMAQAGVSERLLRHCASLGLIRDADRCSHEDVRVLRFTRRAHAMGFGMADVSHLLSLWRDVRRASSDVKQVSLALIEDFDLRIEELQAAKRTLEQLTQRCPGSQWPECPILDELVDLRGFASPWVGEAAHQADGPQLT